MITSADSPISARVLMIDPGRICRDRNLAVSIAEHRIAVPSKLLMIKPAQIAAIPRWPVSMATISPATSKTANPAVVRSDSVRMGGACKASVETARAV